MKTKLSIKTTDEKTRAHLKELCEKLGQELEGRLATFSEDLVSLEGRISVGNAGKPTTVSLRLHLPSGTIASAEEGRDSELAIRKSFQEIRRMLEKHLSQLRHEPDWKRPTRRERLRQLTKGSVEVHPQERRQMFYNLIKEHLDAVYHHVRRELTYLEWSRVIPPGYFTVDDLVDEVILRGLETFESRPLEFSVSEWLHALTTKTLEEELAHLPQFQGGELLSLESPPPLPPAEPTRADEELFEYYQPDEKLRLEDLLPDETAEDTEKAAASHEMQLALHRAIADLPRSWRQALIFTIIEGIPPERTGALLGRTPEQVQADVDHAVAFLLARLVDIGLADENKHTITQHLQAATKIPMSTAHRKGIEKTLT